MFKKSDPWEAGLKIFSKFLGFDVEQDSQSNQVNKGTNGLLSLKTSQQTSSQSKSQQKTTVLKQKWRKLMKFPSKSKHHEVIQLLKQGSAIQQETWVWMMKNTQKISPQLYSQKKEQFHQVVYPKHPSHQTHRQSSNEIEDFEEQPVLQFGNVKGKQQRKRKFSITKNGLFLKSQASNMTGRMSLNSQCSTFSSQTHNSNQLIQPQAKHEISFVDHLLCTKQNRIQSPQSVMKSSFISTPFSPFQPFQLEQSNTFPSDHNPQLSLHLLPQKVTHPILTSIIGAFLVHRQDFSYSITLFNMTATFFYYTNSNQMKTFTLLNHVTCTEFFVHYLTQNWEQSGRIIAYITQKIKRSNPFSHALRNFKLQNFIENWLYGFFYSICQNGSEIKQKIISYLLINTFSIESIVNVCQSLILSLFKIINQPSDDRTYECLQNPKFYIDKVVLFQNLLNYEE